MAQVAVCLYNLASERARGKEWALAEALFERAAGIYAACLGAQHADARDASDKVRCRPRPAAGTGAAPMPAWRVCATTAPGGLRGRAGGGAPGGVSRRSVHGFSLKVVMTTFIVMTTFNAPVSEREPPAGGQV